MVLMVLLIVHVCASLISLTAYLAVQLKDIWCQYSTGQIVLVRQHFSEFDQNVIAMLPA